MPRKTDKTIEQQEVLFDAETNQEEIDYLEETASFEQIEQGQTEAEELESTKEIPKEDNPLSYTMDETGNTNEILLDDSSSSYAVEKSESTNEVIPEGNLLVTGEEIPAENKPINYADDSPILSVDRKNIESYEYREDTLWHEIVNAYRTKRILVGILGGIERVEDGSNIAVLYYKEFRVIIPMSEMMIVLDFSDESDYGDASTRESKILTNMLGCEIDFIIKGLDDASRSIVASRKEAMLRKRRNFYIRQDNQDKPLIYAGRKVEARIIAVSTKSIRVEIFGIECTIPARDISWEWIGNTHDHFSVNERIVVRVNEISGSNVESMTVLADVKSTLPNNTLGKLKLCRVQSRYAGKIIDIYKGMVFIKLSTGVNAVAHSCLDIRTPGINDDISFVVTHIDDYNGVAVGIITRILKQNI